MFGTSSFRKDGERAFRFLVDDYGFAPPTLEVNYGGPFVEETLTYSSSRTAVKINLSQEFDAITVFLVRLVDGAVPSYPVWIDSPEFRHWMTLERLMEARGERLAVPEGKPLDAFKSKDRVVILASLAEAVQKHAEPILRGDHSVFDPTCEAMLGPARTRADAFERSVRDHFAFLTGRLGFRLTRHVRTEAAAHFEYEKNGMGVAIAYGESHPGPVSLYLYHRDPPGQWLNLDALIAARGRLIPNQAGLIESGASAIEAVVSRYAVLLGEVAEDVLAGDFEVARKLDGLRTSLPSPYAYYQLSGASQGFVFRKDTPPRL